MDVNKEKQKSIGLHLQSMRKAAGFKSARAFAEHIGANPNTYTQYEQGLVSFRYEQAWQFADALGCTLDELGGRKTPPKPITNYADEGQRHLDEVYGSLSDVGREKVVGYAEDIAFVHPRDRGEGDIDAGAVETA